MTRIHGRPGQPIPKEFADSPGGWQCQKRPNFRDNQPSGDVRGVKVWVEPARMVRLAVPVVTGMSAAVMPAMIASATIAETEDDRGAVIGITPTVVVVRVVAGIAVA